MSSADGWSIGRSRPDGSGGAAVVRPASVRQCRSRHCDAARAKLFRIEPAAFEAGIINAKWPARMQRLASGALVGRRRAVASLARWRTTMPRRRVVAAALGDLEERVSRPLVVIVGMMGNKDATRFSPTSPG